MEDGGAVGPFDVHKPFGGFCIQLIDDGETKVVVYSRGGMLLKVAGLQADSVGQPVYAMAGGQFGLEEGAEMGQVFAIENLERGLAVVGFRMIGDHRPFVVNGRLLERDRH